MFKLNSHITIGKFNFNYVVNLSITTDIEMLTDTAIIEMPRKLKWKDKNVALGDDPIFKIGDTVIISLGYDNNLEIVFKGYLKDISSGIPVTLQCDDQMYILKKKRVSKSYPSVTLKQLLTDILPADIAFEAVDTNLGKFRINDAPVSKVLEELKSTYGLYSYFLREKLMVGLAYWTDGRQELRFNFQKNIINSRLQYKRAEDVKYRIKAISIDKYNKKTEITVGDDDGDLRTFHYYNLGKSDLEQIANQELEKLKYTGYHGSFDTFGEPTVFVGDIADITDELYPERAGKFLIKQIVRQFGVRTGYRQKITIDKKISE